MSGSARRPPSHKDEPAGTARHDAGRHAPPPCDSVAIPRRPPAPARKTSRTDLSGSPPRSRSWRVCEPGPRRPSRPCPARRNGFDARWRRPAPRGRPGAPGTISRRIAEIVRAVRIELTAPSALTGPIVLIVTTALAVLTIGAVLIAVAR